MRRNQILAEIHTAGRSFVRQLLPSKTDCTLRFNGVSTAYLTVKDTHPVIPQALADGARAVVWLATVDGTTLTKTRLLEGQIGDIEGDGPFGTVTIPVIDDFAWFDDVLAWPDPAAAIGSQTDDYARYTGPSETRALAVIQANVTRLGLPWNVPTSLGRGTTGTTELRMDPLSKILDALTADRLQLSLRRNAVTDTWDVVVSAGAAYPRPLTPQSGVLASWHWKAQRPSKTRMVVGGYGNAAARELATVTDTARETALHRIMEGFTSASGAAAGGTLPPYGTAALADAGQKVALTTVLRETTWFRFPTAYGLGTKVTVQAAPVVVEDVISQIDITNSAEDGFRVVPKIGFAQSDPNIRLADAVSTVIGSVQTLERQ